MISDQSATIGQTEIDELIKQKYSILDKQAVGYLSKMLNDLKNEYTKLETYFLNYLNAAFPRSDKMDHKEFFNQLCEAVGIIAVKEVEMEVNLVLDRPFRMMDEITKHSLVTDLSSDKVSFTSTICDRARLELEKRKMEEKNERRSNTTSKKTADIELAVTQQINKRSTNEKSLDIILENINLAFGSRTLLSNANITISCGRIYGLVGRNGYGKTTFLNALSSRTLSIPENITMYHVIQEVVGDDTTVLDAVVNSNTTVIKLEESIRQLETKSNDLTLSDAQKTEISNAILMKYEEIRGMNLETMIPKAAAILHGLGFNETAQKQPTKKYSGGWRMRVALAQALFMKPDLLLLDEPTNMLDFNSLHWLKNMLPKLGNTLLIVSHDRNFLDAVCTNIIHVTGQKLEVYKGNYSTFARLRQEDYLRQKKQYETMTAHKVHVQKFIDRFSCGTRASSVQSRIKALQKLPDIKCPEEEPKVSFRFHEIEEVKKNFLQLDNISFTYPDGLEILHNCSLCVSPKSRIALVGDNGTGKSTFLKIIIGDFAVTAGQYLPYPKLKCGYMAQHHLDQLPLSQRPIEILASAFPGKTEFEYRNHLGLFGLSGDLAVRPINTLSGGQKTRACLAMVDMARPNVLVFDEPTNHLDIETVDALIDALKAFQGAVIVVSHNEYFVKTLCTELYEIKNKKLKYLPGGFDQYISNITQNFSR